MKPTHAASHLAAFLLLPALSLPALNPSTAFGLSLSKTEQPKLTSALRVSQEGAGLEELQKRFGAPTVAARERIPIPAAGLEEIGLLAYHRALADRINQDGIFHVELYPDGLVQELTFTGRKSSFPGRPLLLHPKYTLLLHYDPHIGLAYLRMSHGEIGQWDLFGNTVHILTPGDLFDGETEWAQLMKAITQAGGVTKVEFGKALSPNLERYSWEKLEKGLLGLGGPFSQVPLPGTMTIYLNKGGIVRISIPPHSWVMEQVTDPAGLEESVEEMVKRLGISQEPITVAMVEEIRRRVLEESGEKVYPRLNAYTTDGRKELFDLVQWMNRESNKPYRWDMSDFLVSDQFGPDKLDPNDPIVHAAFVVWVMAHFPVFKNGNHRTGWALMNVLLLRAGITQRPRVWDENKAPEYYEALRSSEVEPQLRLPVFIAFVKRSLLPTPTTGLEEDTLGGFSTEATGPMVCSFIISPNGDGLYADVLSAPLPKEGWRTEQPPRYLARLAPQTLQVEKRTALMDPGSSLLPNLTPEMSGLVPQEALEVIETPGTSIGGLSTAPDGSSLFLALTDTEEGTRLLRLNPETLEIQATGPKISGSDGFSFSQDQTSLYVKETATSRFVSLDPKTLNPQSPPFPEPILLVLPSPYGPDLFGLQEVREERGDWQLIQSRLVRLDPKTFQVLARSDQRFNVTPLHFAVSPDGSAVYNQEFESEQLLRMNPKNLQVDQRGPSLNRAAFLLLSSDGKALYTEDTQNHLLRLDPITLEVRARGPIVLYPIQLAPGGKALYGLDNHGRLIRLNSQTLKIEARFDQRIRGFAADPTDPAGNIVYVTRDGLEPTLLRLRALPLPAAGLEELKTLHPITRQILENIGAPPGSASEEIDDQSDSSVGLEELA